MKLQLRVHPNNILRQKCREVSRVTPRHKKLAASMHMHMKQWKGYGLAAPQVGRDINLIVVNTMGSGEGERKLTMYNPVIIKRSNNIVEFNEGCLSFPDKFIQIERPETVRVAYIGSDGEKMIETFTNLTARVIQHEIDHLRGILFIDLDK